MPSHHSEHRVEAPQECPLCARRGEIQAAGFRQIYPQHESTPLLLDWWECGYCTSWFVAPVPSKDEIARYWPTVVWQSSKDRDSVAAGKNALFHNVMVGLRSRIGKGHLLDIGSNFGAFLDVARDVGWRAAGLEPNRVAAEWTRSKGFRVIESWSLEPLLAAREKFDAVVAIDVFCYSHQPREDLRSYSELLRVGGILAMRLTNKREWLGLVRNLTVPGLKRDRVLSRGLQAQFHSVRIPAIRRILLDLGFDQVDVISGARTGRWRDMSIGGRLAYIAAAALSAATFGRVNMSPGVLLFARKGLKISE